MVMMMMMCVCVCVPPSSHRPLEHDHQVETAVTASLAHANSRLEARYTNLSEPLFRAHPGIPRYALPDRKQKAGNGAKNANVAKPATNGAGQPNRKRKSVASACEKRGKKQQQKAQQKITTAQRRKVSADVTVRGGVVVGGAPMVRRGSSFADNMSSFALGMDGVGENDDDDAALAMLARMHHHSHDDYRLHHTQQQQHHHQLHYQPQEQQQHHTNHQEQQQYRQQNQHLNHHQHRSQANAHVDVGKSLFLSTLMDGDTNCPSDDAAASFYTPPEYASFLDSLVNAGDAQGVSNVHSASPRAAGDSPRGSRTIDFPEAEANAVGADADATAVGAEGTVTGGVRTSTADKHGALLRSKASDAVVLKTPPSLTRGHQPHLSEIDASAMMAYSVLLGSNSGVGSVVGKAAVMEDPMTPQSNMSKAAAATVSGGASGNGSDYFCSSSHKAAVARCLYFEENDSLEKATSGDAQNSIFSDLCLTEFHGSHTAHTMNSNVLY